jgi:hypothetical protein
LRACISPLLEKQSRAVSIRLRTDEIVLISSLSALTEHTVSITKSSAVECSAAWSDVHEQKKRIAAIAEQKEIFLKNIKNSFNS